MRTQDVTEVYGDWPAVKALVEGGAKRAALLRKLYAELQRRSPGFEGPSIDLFRKMTGYPATQKLTGTGQDLNDSFWGIKKQLQRTGKLAKDKRSGSTVYRVSAEGEPDPPPPPIPEGSQIKKPTWRHDVMRLIRELTPTQFEHLVAAWAKAVTRAEPKVTKRVGDGGFDVVVSFPLVDSKVRIEAKLWNTGKVGPKDVRSLRGALALHRGDSGIVIAPGGFTKAALAEAKNQPEVKLVDGEELLNDMKKHRLGVRVEMVEQITVDDDWFRAFKE